MRENVTRVFGASGLRKNHRHGNYRFVDMYVSKGQTAETLLDQSITKKLLTKKGLERLEYEKINTFYEGKKWWSNNAKENYKQLEGLTNEVIKRTKIYLYILLDIKPIILKNIIKN